MTYNETNSALVLLFTSAAMAAGIDVLPTPQYVEPLPEGVRFVESGQSIQVYVSQAHLKLGVQILSNGFPEAQFVEGPRESGIIFWDYSSSAQPGAPLNFLDRQLLEESHVRSQSYVLRTDRGRLWIIGGGRMGVQ